MNCPWKWKKRVESQSLEEFYKNLRMELRRKFGDGLTFDIPREEFVLAGTIRVPIEHNNIVFRIKGRGVAESFSMDENGISRFLLSAERTNFSDIVLKTEWGRKVVAEAEGLLNLELTLVAAYVAREGMRITLANKNKMFDIKVMYVLCDERLRLKEVKIEVSRQHGAESFGFMAEVINAIENMYELKGDDMKGGDSYGVF